MTHAPLNADQIAALQAFAAEHGRKWKSVLSDTYWPNARIWEEWVDMWCCKRKGYILHGLRNSHGPSWLHGYRLPPR